MPTGYRGNIGLGRPGLKTICRMRKVDGNYSATSRGKLRGAGMNIATPSSHPPQQCRLAAFARDPNDILRAKGKAGAAYVLASLRDVR